MVRNLLICLTTLFIASFSTRAQTLTGVVKDSKTNEPIPFASVFLSNTTFATETNPEGAFNLKNIPIGNHTLVIRLIGYETLYKSIKVANGQTLTFNESLVPSAQQLAEVKVQANRDKTWERNYRTFAQQFMGETAAVKYCKLINPWVIDFEERNNELTAKAEEAIEIENRYLGYRILYTLKSFKTDGNETKFTGHAQFAELWSDKPAEKSFWAANREQVFASSDIHLFQSIITRKTQADGFELYVDKPGENPNARNAFFYQNQSIKLQAVSFDSLTLKKTKDNIYQLYLPPRSELHLTNTEGSFAIYRDKLARVSWLETRGPLFIDQNGLVLNPSEWVASGYLVSQRMAEILPLDYQSSAVKISQKAVPQRWKRSTEKPFFTLDKPYYYAKDVVQVSGVMQYENPLFGDSLSKIARLELVDIVHQKVILSQKIAIENGSFQTRFMLRDSLPAQDYLLRIYTSWMQNFGKNSYSYRWLRVLNENEQVKQTQFEPAGQSLLSATVRDTTIEAVLDAEISKRAKWMSVTFYDTALIKPMNDSLFFAQDVSVPADTSLKFKVEREIELTGTAANAKGKTEEGDVVVLVIPEQKTTLTALTEPNGHFRFGNLSVTNTQPVLVSVTSKKGKNLPNITIVPDTIVIALPENVLPPPMDTYSLTDKAQSTHWSAAGVALQEVKVKAKRAPIAISNIYKEANYVVQGKDIAEAAVGMNILVALQGRVPGLRVVEVVDGAGFQKVVLLLRSSVTGEGFLANGFGAAKTAIPLVLVDGVPFDNVSQIANIPPSQVDRVEIVQRAEAFLGLRGYTGAIAIFTKKKSSEEIRAYENDPNFIKRPVTGIAEVTDIPRDSQSVWLPDLTLQPFSGTAFQLPKPKEKGTYAIKVEGVDYSGKAIRLLHYVTVKP
ncbi:carboxypeptidase-like regulatory domain-containing protein [Runella sp.]|uniref:carboxypeptidase-like regulatory domain-containing protein n=1 Tax=Runella sp. TaxID=1960881 RepID=UPI003D123580